MAWLIENVLTNRTSNILNYLSKYNTYMNKNQNKIRAKTLLTKKNLVHNEKKNQVEQLIPIRLLINYEYLN